MGLDSLADTFMAKALQRLAEQQGLVIFSFFLSYPADTCAQALVEAMTSAGAVHMALNSLADTFMAKALQRLAEQQGLTLGKPDAKSLAERCGGDLSHAIEMLQLVSAGQPCGSPPRLPAAKVPPLL